MNPTTDGHTTQTYRDGRFLLSDKRVERRALSHVGIPHEPHHHVRVLAATSLLVARCRRRRHRRRRGLQPFQQLLPPQHLAVVLSQLRLRHRERPRRPRRPSRLRRRRRALVRRGGVVILVV